MRVVLSSDCFDRASVGDLLQLFFFGARGRHRVYPEALNAPAYLAWLSARDPAVREVCELSIRGATLEEVRNPSARAVRVVPSVATQWDAKPPTVSIDDAINFLATAFTFVLEDGENDREFLLAFCTREEREWLVDQEKRSHLIFANGGGVGSMTRLAGELAQNQRRQLLHWMLFDSDALRPGVPSQQSMLLAEACKTANVLFHQLCRRFAESYLPIRSLHGWVYGSTSRKRDHEPRYLAFAALSDPQRQHFHMKKGFEQDRRRYESGDTAGDLYNDVPESSMEELEAGFGSNIGSLYSEGWVHEVELRKESGWSELRAALHGAMALLR